MASRSKTKRRNSEKRKEKSRDAARSRRGKECEVFSDLSDQLPIAPSVLHTLDKASIMRIAISHLKLRTLLGPSPEPEEGKKACQARRMDSQYSKVLSGFVMVIALEGDMVYLSENVSKVLGLSQIDLLGQSIYEFAHPCDHDEIREVLEKTVPDERNMERDFIMRMKCTLTSKGKNINLKSATYKAVHCAGRVVTVEEDTYYGGVGTRSITCLIIIADPIPHPSNIEIPLDSSTFLSTHSNNMRYTYADPRMLELLGYDPDDVLDHSLYSFFHAADQQQLNKAYRDLFNKGQTMTGQYRFLAKNGGYAWVETQSTVIYNTRTEKPQHVVCVNYVISGIEEPSLILSDVQVSSKKASVTKAASAVKSNVKVTKTPKTSRKVEPLRNRSNVVLATESIFSKSLHDFDKQDIDEQILMEDLEKLEDIAYRAPNAGDVMVTLDYKTAGIDPLLLGMEPLLPDIYEDISSAHASADSDEISAASNTDPLPFMMTITREPEAEKPKASKENPLPSPNEAPMLAVANKIVKITKLNQDDSPMLENLESPSESPHDMTQIVKDVPHAIQEETVVISDSDEGDMVQRAPYISMSGDIDYVFSPKGDSVEQIDCGSFTMLGKTESVFSSLPEEEEEKKQNNNTIPINILRQQESQRKKREYLRIIHHRSDMTKINKPTETNRLETGPPAPKRMKMVAVPVSTVTTPQVMEMPSASKTATENVVAAKGSSVLLNLLLKGEDKVNGYALPPPQKPLHHSVQDEAFGQGMLRCLLTSPMGESPIIIRKNRRDDGSYTTFNPDLIHMLGMQSEISSVYSDSSSD